MEIAKIYVKHYGFIFMALGKKQVSTMAAQLPCDKWKQSVNISTSVYIQDRYNDILFLS